MHYTGIGSRRTPADILELMEELAERLRDGMILRSGHAPGADQAFERGAREDSEIFLPWPGFFCSRGDVGDMAVLGEPFEKPTLEAAEIAAEHHPAWDRLGSAVRKLHARNVHQILGYTLDEPSAFVLCWTPDGSLNGLGPDTGGTGQALRIATTWDIPVYNLSRQNHFELAQEWLSR